MGFGTCDVNQANESVGSGQGQHGMPGADDVCLFWAREFMD